MTTRGLRETIGALSLATLLATLAVAGPARADNVTVTFGVSVMGADSLAPAAARTCPVSVPSGSDGLVLLASAKAQRCISSYATAPRYDYYGTPIDGSYVRCIDSVCDMTTSHWDAVENGNRSYPDYWYGRFGLEGFHADQGDRVVFSYIEYGLICPCL